jgi:hypothetical protein
MKPSRSKNKNSTSKQNLILGGAAVVIITAIAWSSLRAPNRQLTDSEIAAMSAGVLSPSIFSDAKARAAYQVAKDIPEVLAQLPCFCGCKDNYGHENNLFCFKDMHGSGCEICQDIALDARRMHDEGMPIDQIRDNIVARYSRYQP